jgi:hypothetical protein
VLKAFSSRRGGTVLLREAPRWHHVLELLREANSKYTNSPSSGCIAGERSTATHCPDGIDPEPTNDINQSAACHRDSTVRLPRVLRYTTLMPPRPRRLPTSIQQSGSSMAGQGCIPLSCCTPCMFFASMHVEARIAFIAAQLSYYSTVQYSFPVFQTAHIVL